MCLYYCESAQFLQWLSQVPDCCPILRETFLATIRNISHGLSHKNCTSDLCQCYDWRKFLVLRLTSHWSGTFWNAITSPGGCWCGTFGGNGICGCLGCRGSTGAVWWVCTNVIVGWNGRGKWQFVWVKYDFADVWCPPPPPALFLTLLVQDLKIVRTLLLAFVIRGRLFWLQQYYDRQLIVHSWSTCQNYQE